MRNEHEHSVLILHAPGHQQALLDYITGDGEYPQIETGELAAWQREVIDGGHLREYVEQLRTLFSTGKNPGGTYLACPLCPMALCGTGLDTAAAIEASQADAYEHLVAHRRSSGAQIHPIAAPVQTR